MPFRLWFYLAKVGGFGLFVVIGITLGAAADSMAGHVRLVATWLLIPLCTAGAFMGLLMAFDKLRMRCPFCGKSGRAGGNKRDGMWMECENCGVIRGSGPLGLKIVREEMGEEDDEADGTA